MSIFSLLREHTQVAMAVATKIWLDAPPKLDGLPPTRTRRSISSRAGVMLTRGAKGSRLMAVVMELSARSVPKNALCFDWRASATRVPGGYDVTKGQRLLLRGNDHGEYDLLFRDYLTPGHLAAMV
jgi:hypothetical protein